MTPEERDNELDYELYDDDEGERDLTCPRCGGRGIEWDGPEPCPMCDGEGYLYWLT
jgi:rubrerythrin